MGQSTMVWMLLALQLFQLVCFGAGFMMLYRKVQTALDRRAVSLRRLALSASSGEHAQALRSEVQSVHQRMRHIEATANHLFLSQLLERPMYNQPMARTA